LEQIGSQDKKERGEGISLSDTSFAREGFTMQFNEEN